MIGSIRGIIIDRDHETVIVEVGGVGYIVSVTPRTLSDLPGIDNEVLLHTHLNVREDQLALFGFGTKADKELFGMLLGVSGVGPKVAMAILGTMTYDQLSVAVATDDIPALTAVPGIGKRSAQKLLLELKPKMDVADGPITTTGPLAEAREALEGLGYGPDEVRATLLEMPLDLPIEDLIKRSLQHLARRTLDA